MARFQQKIHWILHNSDADLRQFKRHSSARFVFACSLAVILPIFSGGLGVNVGDG